MNDQLTEVIEFDDDANASNTIAWDTPTDGQILEPVQFEDSEDDAADTAIYPSIAEPTVTAPAGPSLVPLYPVAEPYLGTAHLPPIPEPPVNTAARPVTIVWGFIIMAIGILAITMAAGAAIDLGLALVWLPAIAGSALIIGAIMAALRRKRQPL